MEVSRYFEAPLTFAPGTPLPVNETYKPSPAATIKPLKIFRRKC